MCIHTCPFLQTLQLNFLSYRDVHWAHGVSSKTTWTKLKEPFNNKMHYKVNQMRNRISQFSWSWSDLLLGVLQLGHCFSTYWTLSCLHSACIHSHALGCLQSWCFRHVNVTNHTPTHGWQPSSAAYTEGWSNPWRYLWPGGKEGGKGGSPLGEPRSATLSLGLAHLLKQLKMA